MSSQQWSGPLAYVITPGTQYNTYTTAKSMLSATTATEASAGIFTLPGSALQRGSFLKWTVDASISNRVTGPDTFTINIMFGSVIAFTTGAITLTTTAHTNIPALIEIWLSCHVVGTLAQMRGRSRITGQMIQQGGTAAADSATLTNTALYPNTASALGTAFDGTLGFAVDFQVAQSVSNAGNGFRVDQYLVEGKNLLNMS